MPGVMDNWCGSVRLMAVPAEELIEIGYREELRKQGIIKYFGGKVEFLHRGYYDGVDIAYMVHTGNMPIKGMGFAPGNNGCITKNGEYIETLKNGKYCITYIPCYNVFSIEYYGLEEENKDILFAFNEDIIGLTPDAEGVVRYNDLEAAGGAYFTFAITETDYLPITLDPEVNPGLVEIIVEEGCYIVFINEAGTYNISYNLNTEVLSIEAIDN